MARSSCVLKGGTQDSNGQWQTVEQVWLAIQQARSSPRLAPSGTPLATDFQTDFAVSGGLVAGDGILFQLPA
jgi:hypothetical protein